MTAELARISAPHFVAGVLLDEDGVVTKAPPIVRYMVGWTRHRLVNYCAEKGWIVQVIR